jgi:putative redox protein
MTRSCFSLDMDTFEKTKEAIRNDPNLGKGTFSTVTEWVDGSLARTTARSFTIETDEPAPLGGTDKAIDPMELLLAAVGTCLQIGWVTHANRRGVDFRSLRIETRGDYDLQGYLALDRSIPPGFTNISYTVEVDTDADPALLEEIRAAAENGSPVTQNVLKGTPIQSDVKKL